MSKYLLHGKLTAKEGAGEKLSAILLESSKLAMKGCTAYIISKDNNDKDSVWITEVWDSKEDHDNSLKLESVRAVIGKAVLLIAGQPQKGQELEVLGGLGV